LFLDLVMMMVIIFSEGDLMVSGDNESGVVEC
jgi:hypothetical protein